MAPLPTPPPTPSPLGAHLLRSCRVAVDLPVRRHLHSWCTNGLSMQGKVATRGSADLGTAKGGGGGPARRGWAQGSGTSVAAPPVFCIRSAERDTRRRGAVRTRQHVALVAADDHAHSLQVDHQRLLADQDGRGEGDGHGGVQGQQVSVPDAQGRHDAVLVHLERGPGGVRVVTCCLSTWRGRGFTQPALGPPNCGRGCVGAARHEQSGLEEPSAAAGPTSTSVPVPWASTWSHGWRTDAGPPTCRGSGKRVFKKQPSWAGRRLEAQPQCTCLSQPGGCQPLRQHPAHQRAGHIAQERSPQLVRLPVQLCIICGCILVPCSRAWPHSAQHAPAATRRRRLCRRAACAR